MALEIKGISLNSFQKKNQKNVEKMSHDPEIKRLTAEWFNASLRYEYLHHFSWLGIPIIQCPQDVMAMQEIIWKTKPDLIIETGIAYGGSLVFYASMLEIIGNNGQVLGIDIDIRKHNRMKIEKHPMFKRISMIEGSSVDKHVLKNVYQFAAGKQKVLVVLDSNHTHEHVLQELHSYSSLITMHSYLVVFDTVIEDIPDELCKGRPWDKESNPKSAVREFLKTNKRFEIDKEIEKKLLITVAPDGYLKRVR